jgi:hypothetical protein
MQSEAKQRVAAFFDVLRAARSRVFRPEKISG